jgi:hypothetical protein
MEVRDQLQVPAALPPAKDLLLTRRNNRITQKYTEETYRQIKEMGG